MYFQLITLKKVENYQKLTSKPVDIHLLNQRELTYFKGSLIEF